ncbi:CinA family protein [Rubinisphaera sp. JC750]|uniref:CinA family protein n=1 Tax=Rubinisphaera sp. JC750 TaxID=2898658 RepID=UPI001F00CC50|nr:nicotinamide-nucleotide amidohydrolase family protein [Rubinisphaera sp. JC750]
MTDMLSIARAARNLRTALENKNQRIVFAESCTAGLMATTLSQIAGVSEILCGSAVTYRNATKSAWLDVSQEVLDDPKIGPVSEVVARQMAFGVLHKTREASIAVSITGHLGPHAPENLDGVAFAGICQQGSSLYDIQVIEYQLPDTYPDLTDANELRIRRQIDLVTRVFTDVAQVLT